MLAERYGFTHLSAGDLLRSEIAWETERGKRFMQLLRAKGEIGIFEGLEMVRVRRKGKKERRERKSRLKAVSKGQKAFFC